MVQISLAQESKDLEVSVLVLLLKEEIFFVLRLKGWI